MGSEPRYWFPAKRYGWGWGAPSTWQGWVVLVAFLVATAFGALVWPTPKHQPEFAIWTGVTIVLLAAICWWKGEPPGWHWGE